MQENKIIIRNGRLFEPGHNLHNQLVFLLIDNGVITRLESSNFQDSNGLEIDATGCTLSAGMFDLRCQFKDPGFEHQEDIKSGSRAAAAGGFTGIALQPTTEPITQSKSQIEYINKIQQDVLPRLYPIGASTIDLNSEEITEMFDMKQAGAVAFSNGDKPYHSGGGLMRALMYSTTIDTLIMSHAQDKFLTGDGSVNESATTIHTGLKQQASITETTQIRKEIEIAKYAQSRIHFSHISAAESVEIIRQAKAEGVSITCDVCIWHLVYTDESVLSFDSNFKVNPPFRTETDRLALIKGVNDGTIDAVVSDHNPHNVEDKLVEFDYASFGITGLQTFYSVYREHISDVINETTWWDKTVSSPRKILGLELPSISIGSEADLWVADPEAEWTLNRDSNLSKSMNNPKWNSQLKGRCKLTVKGKMAQVVNK